VVQTLTKMRDGLVARGWQVHVLGPTGVTVSCPTYPEIRLTLEPTKVIYEAMQDGIPDAVHIATEGPLGRAMRGLCLRKGWSYTTSFHTRFPEYLKARFGIPRRWTYSYLRIFHAHARRVLAPTPSIVEALKARGFANVELWGRGVDTELFHPSKRRPLPLAKPIQLYVGRLAVEKNLPAFLSLPTEGTKVVVGDGPDRARLQKEFPNAVFMGVLKGENLAEVYASADVFVFPSRTDTFGLVLLEALASGVPVAAYPSEGPKDLLHGSKAGVLDEDLGTAVEAALKLHRPDCRAFALNHGWSKAVNQFASQLVSLTPRELSDENLSRKWRANTWTSLAQSAEATDETQAEDFVEAEWMRPST
jgi:glycosyltransferase involved in cell wall biosynthesis